MEDYDKIEYFASGAKRLISLILMVILCFTVLPITPAYAVGTHTWTTVRVSAGINNALYLSEDGKPEDYCNEYLTQLAKINHWNLEYVEGSWNDSIENLKNGKIDLLFPTQMTEEGKNTMGFSTAIGGYQPIGLYANPDSKFCYDDFAAFDVKRITVSAGTSNEEALRRYAEQNGFTYEPVYLDTADEKKQALETGTVDLMVFSTLNDVPDGKVVAMLDYLPFYYCTRIDDAELLAELNYGMNQMLLRQPTLVQDVFYNFMNRNVFFAYTAAEQEEIVEHGKVMVGIYMDTPPLFDLDESGNPIGIYVDIIERIKELSGLDIEIKPLNRKEQAFDYLMEGNLDFIFGSSDQALKYSDEVGFAQSEGVMDYYTVGITRSDFSKTEEDSMVIALTGGRRYWETSIQKKCPNATLAYFDNLKDCLNAVHSGKADVTLLNSWEYNYQSKNQRYEDLIEWDNTRTLSQSVFVSLDTQHELLRSVLDKPIEQISNAEKEAFITANLNRPYASYDLSDRFYEMKESIFRAIKYQLAIIGDLLDIQKIESGKMDLVPVEVNSAEYMENIVSMIVSEAKEKDIEFTYERLNTVNDTYLLDRVRFQQVLLNLLHNAVKFTPNGGKVKMTAEVVDQNAVANTLKFVISDTGIGMSEDFQQNYLFHRFAQEYKGNTSPYEGCGTGLAISRDIMHLMGGEITCQSTQGVGSTFTVILTAKHIAKKRKRRERMDMSSCDLSGIRVLLCEDNQMNQDIERRLLEKMNCKVDIAADGQIGVDLFAKSAAGTIDVILMDIRMPNMDGLEAAKQIRELERSDAQTVPILAVSANSFEEDVQKSLAAGMNEHLAKPVDVKILYEKIQHYCIKGR